MRTKWLRRRAMGALLLTTACTAWAQPSSPAVVASPERAAPPSVRERQFARLVSERARAIELAFGETFTPRVQELRIVLVRSGKWASGTSNRRLRARVAHALLCATPAVRGSADLDGVHDAVLALVRPVHARVLSGRGDHRRRAVDCRAGGSGASARSDVAACSMQLVRYRRATAVRHAAVRRRCAHDADHTAAVQREPHVRYLARGSCGIPRAGLARR